MVDGKAGSARQRAVFARLEGDGCPAVPRCHEGHKGVGIDPFVDG